MPLEQQLCIKELAPRRFFNQLVLPQTVKGLMEVGFMNLTGLAEYNNIFQVNYYTLSEELIKRLVNESGKGGGGIVYAEIHESAHQWHIARTEGGIGFIPAAIKTFMYLSVRFILIKILAPASVSNSSYLRGRGYQLFTVTASRA